MCDSRPSSGPSRLESCRRGVSLFEILLALAILGLIVAGVAPLQGHATRTALQARLETEGQFRSLSILREYLSGNYRNGPVSGQCDDDPRWSWRIDVLDQPSLELTGVRVVVEYSPSAGQVPVVFQHCQLVRCSVLEQRGQASIGGTE